MSIYVISFPIISSYITAIFPMFGQCPYFVITGCPCPLCGGTRYFANIYQAFQNLSYLRHPFGIMGIAIVLELIMRSTILIISQKREISKKIIKIDVVIHVIAVLLFVFYEIVFFIK